MYGDPTPNYHAESTLTSEPTFDVDDVTKQIHDRLMTAEKLLAVLREENTALRSRLFGIYEAAKRIA